MDKKQVFINTAGYSDEDQRQMMEAINAFKEGKEPPEGRFKIIGTLSKES